jgi:hypothetical protein
LDRASDITAATQVGVVVSDITHFYPQAGFEVFCGGTFEPRLAIFLPAAVLESSSASASHLKQVDWPVPILAIWFLAPIRLEAGRISSTRCVRCFAMRKLCVIPALSGRKFVSLYRCHVGNRACSCPHCGQARPTKKFIPDILKVSMNCFSLAPLPA